jgi:hypothetical protein
VDTTLVANLVIAALGVIAAFAQTRRNQDRGRRQVRQDAELFKLLPEESAARKELLAHIDKQIVRLIRNEDELTRDPTGVLLAIIFLVVAAALVVTSFREGGIWWFLIVPASFFGIFGLVGLGQDLPRRKRDERGRAITEGTKSEKTENSTTTIKRV